MKIDIKLKPEDFGKSGTFAVCVFCAKGTEYQICCDTYKGLMEIDYDNVDEIAREYSFTADQFDALYEALTKFTENKGAN